MEEKIKKSLNKLDNVNYWISNSDTKSAFLLTLLGVILTIIFTSDIGAEMIRAFYCKNITATSYQCINYSFRIIFVIAFFAGLFFTFYCIYKTLRARIDTKKYKQDGLMTESNIFFGTISLKSFSVFEQSTNGETDDEYLKDINSQIFINSQIANLKFKYYNKSLISMLITLGCFLVFIITIV